MYIGGTDQRGLHHLVIEIVNNSIDEAMAGRCDHVWVHIAKDGRVTQKTIGKIDKNYIVSGHLYLSNVPAGLRTTVCE
jgi:hypothetical protein